MHYVPNGNPIEPVDLQPGDVIAFIDDRGAWTVQAVTEHYAAATREPTRAERDEYRELHGFEPEDGPLYTVLDWRSGVRGPCDLIGQSFGDGTYSPDECAQMLAGFEDTMLAVSQRNNVPIRITNRTRGNAHTIWGRSRITHLPSSRPESTP